MWTFHDRKIKEIWRAIHESDRRGGRIQTAVFRQGLDIAPLKKLLEETVDEERIRRSPRDFCAASFSVTDRKEEDFDVKAAPLGP